jgi:hypothetical protein
MVRRLLGIIAAAVLIGTAVMLFAEPVLARCATGGCA